MLSEKNKPTGQIRQENGPDGDEIKQVLINKAEKKKPVLLSHSLPLPLLLLNRPSSTNFLSEDANVSTANGSEGQNQNASPIDTTTDKSDRKTKTELLGDSSATKVVSKRNIDAVQHSSERNGSSDNVPSHLNVTPEINKVSAEVPAPNVLKETANKLTARNPADSSVTTIEEKLINETSSFNLFMETHNDASHEVQFNPNTQEEQETITVEAISPSLPDVPVITMAQETQEEKNNVFSSTETYIDASHEVPGSSNAQGGLKMVTVEAISPSLPDVPVNPMAQKPQEENNDASSFTETNTDASYEVQGSSNAQEGPEMVTVEVISPFLPNVPVNLMPQETQETNNDASSFTETNTDASHEVPASSDAQEGPEMVTVEVTLPSLPDVPVNLMAQETQEESNDASTFTETKTDASHEVPAGSDAQEGPEMVTVEVISPSLPDVPVNPMAQETQEEKNNVFSSTETNTDASHEVPASSDAQEGPEMVTVEVISPSLPDVPVNLMAQETLETNNDASSFTETNTDASHEVPASSDAQEGPEMVTVEVISPSLPDVPVNLMAQETLETNNDASSFTETNTDASHEVPASSDAQEGPEMVTVEVTLPSLPDVPVNLMAQETQETNNDASSFTKTNTDAAREISSSANAQEATVTVQNSLPSLSNDAHGSSFIEAETDASYEVPINSNAQESKATTTGKFASSSLPGTLVNQMTQKVHEEENSAFLPMETDTGASFEIPVNQSVQQALDKVASEVSLSSLSDVSANLMAQETQEKVNPAFLSVETDSDATHKVPLSKNEGESQEVVEKEISPSSPPDVSGNQIAQEAQEEGNDTSFSLETVRDESSEVPINESMKEALEIKAKEATASSLLDVPIGQMVQMGVAEPNDGSSYIEPMADSPSKYQENQTVQEPLVKVGKDSSSSSLANVPMAHHPQEEENGSSLSTKTITETDAEGSFQAPENLIVQESQQNFAKVLTPSSFLDDEVSPVAQEAQREAQEEGKGISLFVKAERVPSSEALAVPKVLEERENANSVPLSKETRALTDIEANIEAKEDIPGKPQPSPTIWKNKEGATSNILSHQLPIQKKVKVANELPTSSFPIKTATTASNDVKIPLADKIASSKVRKHSEKEAFPAALKAKMDSTKSVIADNSPGKLKQVALASFL